MGLSTCGMVSGERCVTIQMTTLVKFLNKKFFFRNKGHFLFLLIQRGRKMIVSGAFQRYLLQKGLLKTASNIMVCFCVF